MCEKYGKEMMPLERNLEEFLKVLECVLDMRPQTRRQLDQQTLNNKNNYFYCYYPMSCG